MSKLSRQSQTVTESGHQVSRFFSSQSIRTYPSPLGSVFSDLYFRCRRVSLAILSVNAFSSLGFGAIISFLGQEEDMLPRCEQQGKRSAIL